MDNEKQKWQLKKIKSIRVSAELLEMILGEVTRRNSTFSGFVRDATIAEMNRRRWIVS